MAIQSKDILCSVSFSTAMKWCLLKWQKVLPSESSNVPVTVTFPACHTSQASGHQFHALGKQCPSADGAMSNSFYDEVCRKHDLACDAAPQSFHFLSRLRLHISSTSSNCSCFFLSFENEGSVCVHVLC